ncbi:conserved hypothetical protein [Burkholderia vietnamiensis]|nr:conserved hypothetical protein [Burkholderia vietnamiensis]SOT46161.1 hypothetical protein F01_570147 [Burkholderia cenocepacia]
MRSLGRQPPIHKVSILSGLTEMRVKQIPGC